MHNADTIPDNATRLAGIMYPLWLKNTVAETIVIIKRKERNVSILFVKIFAFNDFMLNFCL